VFPHVTKMPSLTYNCVGILVEKNAELILELDTTDVYNSTCPHLSA